MRSRWMLANLRRQSILVLDLISNKNKLTLKVYERPKRTQSAVFELFVDIDVLRIDFAE